MNCLLPSSRVLLLFLILSVVFCDRLDPSPDVIEQCINDDSCGANNASFVSFYHYVVGEDDDNDDDKNSNTTTTTSGVNKKGVQYTICATNYTGTSGSDNIITDVGADSICKINEVTMVLPEDSNEECPTDSGEPFLSGSDCIDHCNNVIFKEWNENEANDYNELDNDDIFGENKYNTVSTATISLGGNDVCFCKWGNNTSIVGCVSSDAAVGTTTSFATVVVIAVIVACATAIEMVAFV